MGSAEAVHLRPRDKTLLRVEDLSVEFPAGWGRRVHAVSDVSLDVLPGETVSLVGESGCGKSTTGRAIVQLPRPTGGRVIFDGTDLTSLSRARLREQRPHIQFIYQDPISSLNPRRSIADIVAEPLKVWHGGDAAARAERVCTMLESVGLKQTVHRRRPREFSGGQCQRVSIARALILDPKLVICDEPLSALDVSVQAQILNLLEDMKDRYGISLLFISHYLAVVKNVSDRVMVMYLGKLCEVASTDAFYAGPAHPYSAALLAAVPEPAVGAVQPAIRLSGELPSPTAPPSGCRFRTRCPRAETRCAIEVPELRRVATGEEHFVACHFPLIPVTSTP